jgi:hypothetical protein
LRLHASFVNNFWVAFIQPSCNNKYDKYDKSNKYIISNISKISMIYLVDEVLSTPPEQRRKHTSAFSGRGLSSILSQTAEDFCRTKRYPFVAQRHHARFRAGVWIQSLDDWLLSIFWRQKAKRKYAARLGALYVR